MTRSTHLRSASGETKFRSGQGPAFVLVAVLLTATGAFAQEPDPGRESHWGVSGSLIPRWEFPRALAEVWNLDTDMKGSEFRVGIVRGSDLGGDWGVSFVKKVIDDDSVVQLREQACVQLPGGSAQCARGAYHVTRDAGMRGVEAHLFMPFGTIKRRVQVGATFAGGVAEIQGTSNRFIEHLVVNGSRVTLATESIGSGPFKETLQDLPQDWKVVPIGRVALGVAVIAAPGFKIRAEGGVNFPGYHRVAVHAHYLFGAQ
jgi:hypothetical protein